MMLHRQCPGTPFCLCEGDDFCDIDFPQHPIPFLGEGEDGTAISSFFASSLFQILVASILQMKRLRLRAAKCSSNKGRGRACDCITP